MDNSKYLNALKNGVKPALGCTEPVAVGLAATKAYEQVGGEIKSVHAFLSPNIIKNGMGVGIPGTKEKGLKFAIALALVCGNSSYGLEIFKDVNDSYIDIANSIINNDIIELIVEKNDSSLYIEVDVETTNGVGKCIIKDNHTNITLVSKNNEVIYKKQTHELEQDLNALNFDELTIEQIIQFAQNVSFDDIKFLLDGYSMNMDIAYVGYVNKSGLGVGAAIADSLGVKLEELDILNKIRVLTASASDARMSGINMPVMSSAGSGNHGLTAIIPPALVCEELSCNEEKLARSLAISHLVTALVKNYTGSLSPVCGCSVAAGVGSSAAIAWILNGNIQQINGAVKNMIGTLSGMICDGAKEGCALKLSTSSSESYIQAALAIKGVIIKPTDGIVSQSAEDSIKNLGIVSTKGFVNADEEILKVMMNK